MTHPTASVAAALSDRANQENHTRSDRLPVLVLGALGVVYGDIGTSPIYALRQGIAALGGEAVTPDNILGLLSLIAWSLTLVVAVKYAFFVTRADNNGEGGILALTTLARSAFASRPFWLLALGVIGSALFFGDSMITPAISVLSAIEGLESIAPSFSEFVLPVTVAILVALFAFQRFGTARVSGVFGPIVIVWFLMLGVSGAVHIAQQPAVLWALSPTHAVTFLVAHWGIAGLVIGAVFLAVTGAEALYADMGHFGRRPIVIAWFSLVFPCLLINYFGQGAFVLRVGGESASDPFFLMFPDWSRVAVIIVTTAATVIASQAVISGTYSLVQQAMALNILPRMRLLHTSETQSGQIYMPQVNTLLLVAVLALVIGFRSSAALSSAYGIAVSGVMLLTAVFISIVMWRQWHWHPVAVGLTMAPFVALDIGFFVANIGKFHDGGWFPATVAVVLTGLMVIWIAGRRRLLEKTRRDEVPLQMLVDNLTSSRRPTIVPGTAIFLTSDLEGAPTALLHSLKHYKVLHEQNVIVTVVTANSPYVPDDEKVRIASLSELFTRVVITFGFVETPNIPKALGLARKLGWKFDIMATSFFLSRRSLKPSARGGLFFWIDRPFIWLSKNATDATEYFHIPTGRVVEIGTQVVL